MQRKSKVHPVTDYARKVVTGKIIAGELVIMACNRHLDDLKTAKKRGFYFDEAAADIAFEFFEENLVHTKGEWAGRAFLLKPWQKFIIGSLFGWRKTKDKTRRFQTAYDEIPRKNGKSTVAAGVGLKCFAVDAEPGAEVYAAATKKDQAKIVFEEAKAMVQKSPELASLIHIVQNNLSITEDRAKFEPLGADADNLDGLNVHCAIIDELHAHRKRLLWDVLETATGARRQPLIFAITTAGTDIHGICYENREYSIKVLKGVIQDDSWFAYIATIDEGDNWQDPKVWAKANPNLGVSAKLEDLQRKAKKAAQAPAAQNAFKRLHLNVWTQAVSRWLDLAVWDKNAGILDEAKLYGRKCYGGLDLSSVSDLTAWALVFPDDEDPELFDLLVRIFCPESRLYADDNKYADQYQAWARDGHLIATPGNAVDYDFVEAQILKDTSRFKLVDLNIDRLFQAHQLAQKLENEGLKVFPMGQGFLSMTTPAKEFERRLLLGKCRHGGHPVLRWMADSVTVRTDPAENIKPDKQNSLGGKIDGIVAAIMALDRQMRHMSKKKSKYETEGVKVF